MKAYALRSRLNTGTVSTKKGTLLETRLAAYSDLLKRRPTKNDMKSVNTIGKNRFTFSVVSSMITAKLNDNLEYPARTDAAPIVA